MSIDGGFDYQRIAFQSKLPMAVSFELDLSQVDLLRDWNESINKHGIIPRELVGMIIGLERKPLELPEVH